MAIIVSLVHTFYYFNNSETAHTNFWVLTFKLENLTNFTLRLKTPCTIVLAHNKYAGII